MILDLWFMIYYLDDFRIDEITDTGCIGLFINLFIDLFIDLFINLFIVLILFIICYLLILFIDNDAIFLWEERGLVERYD